MSKELTEFRKHLDKETFEQAPRGCEEEPFLSLGTIQAHGMLLALDEQLTVVQVSVNITQWLPYTPKALLGQAFQVLVTPASYALLQTMLGQEPQRFHLSFVDTIGSFDARLHHSDGLWLLELTPPCADALPAGDALFSQLDQIGEQLQSAEDVPSMASSLVNALRGLSGFDQVLVMRFDEDGHGEVIAESRETTMPGYLGLRFPATDVPYQVRRHMVRHPLRMVPDQLADGVALEPPQHPLHGGVQNLAGCELRAGHPWCREFYRNMGVRATLHVAVVQDGQLWGYVACHHASVRYLSPTLRFALQSSARLFAALLHSKRLSSQMADERRLLALLDQLINRVNDACHWQQGLLSNPDDLLTLAGATGAALYDDGNCQVVGRGPPLAVVSELVAWLRQGGQPLFVSQCLANSYPSAAAFSDSAAGLLAIALSDDRQRWLLWFRPEVSRQLRWAGEPKHGLRHKNGQIALSSRFSFAQWEEQVRGHAEPFKPLQLEAIVRLRTALYKRFLQLAESQNRQIRARLAVLLESLQEVVWSMGLPGGEMQEISPSVEVITGYAPEAFLQHPELWWELIHPQDRTRIRQILLEDIQARPSMFDMRIVPRDGEVRWLRVRARRMVFGDDDGDYVAGVMSDITERKSNEEALRESEERFRLLVESSIQGLCILDAQGYLRFTNPTAEELLGLSLMRRPLHQHLIYERVVQQDRERLERYVKTCLQDTQKPQRDSFRVSCTIHQELVIDTLARQIIWEGKPAVQVAMVDVTDRERVQRRLREALDAALEANQAKSTFLATMSHELRTPLNSIIGFSGIIRDGMAGPVSHEQRKQLDMVHDSARHLLALINEILDLSKIETGRSQINLHWFSMQTFMKQLQQLLAPQAQARGLELTVSCPDDIGDVYSDVDKLRQIVTNLTSNAVKFTERGKISVTCQRLDDGVGIIVKDTGIGIAGYQLEHIFEPFFQADSGDRRRFQGTGLGLAICQRLSIMLGGKLQASSRQGEGSEFRLWLPIVAEDVRH